MANLSILIYNPPLKTMLLYLLASVSIFLAGCKTPDPNELISPTTGYIHIMVDENLKDLIEQEREAFETAYKYAKLKVEYGPEYDVVNDFMEDSVDVIFLARKLNEQEVLFLNRKKFFPRQTHFATGALAFISAKNNRDTAFTYEAIINMLKDSTQGKQFVIENAKSGISRQILDAIGIDQLPGHFFAQKTKQEVIKYVSTHNNAIGIIDYSDISDSDAPYSRQVLESISMLAISRPRDSTQMGFLRPYQYNLQDRQYPFTRQLHCINKTGLNDVGAGFSAYVAGHVGQRIVLKAGLLPEYQSARWIELKSGAEPVVEK